MAGHKKFAGCMCTVFKVLHCGADRVGNADDISVLGSFVEGNWKLAVSIRFEGSSVVELTQITVSYHSR